ncbi:HupE / UreJ protein [Roseovarius sp. THAF8]|uniref:HupE/UreJ family protein n=1 Tax=Roseovarius sp. THAF8 TaxID=2587846 RepID=UPI001268C553|nr:HupE/UreJ family protein [Roseovarius sp. THAF8]QFT99215.1 HupE / UreJ protein [Roseovarius sp. THAF8]
MRSLAFTLIPAVLAAGPAFAHLDPGAHGSFAAGLSHPVFGADHILAMVAVGLWAASLGGRAFVALPVGFVGAMALGFLLSLAGLPLPMVEPMILVSVLVLGVLVAAAARVPLSAAVAITAALGVFHGHAHGTEIGGAGALAYLAGFVAATTALHALGATAGWALGRFGGALLTRGAGLAVAIGGSALVMAG